MAELEKESFEQYYSKYYQQVYKYILKKVLSIPVAEDLAMDAFFACYKRFDEFNPEKASFATWLYVVVNNKLKNYYRDHKIFEDSDERNTVIEGFEDELLAGTYLDEMRQELYKALQILSDTQRSIIIYKYFRGKNSNEIAEIVGINSGNVRVQLTRAIGKLREYFDKNNIKWEI